MALTECKECGANVSKKAASCPNCGNPITPPKKTMVSKPLGCILQLAALFLIMFGIAILRDPTGGASGIVMLMMGAVLLFVGGRTKARL
jgi:uncharacterized paraquat-inducible protein A